MAKRQRWLGWIMLDLAGKMGQGIWDIGRSGGKVAYISVFVDFLHLSLRGRPRLNFCFNAGLHVVV